MTDMKLTETECFELEKNYMETELKRSDQTIAKLKMEIFKLRNQLLVAQKREHDLETRNLTTHLETIKSKLESLASEHTEVLDGIRDRLGIEGPISFDPDTLEVIHSDETATTQGEDIDGE